MQYQQYSARHRPDRVKSFVVLGALSFSGGISAATILQHKLFHKAALVSVGVWWKSPGVLVLNSPTIISLDSGGYR